MMLCGSNKLKFGLHVYFNVEIRKNITSPTISFIQMCIQGDDKRMKKCMAYLTVTLRTKFLLVFSGGGGISG